jgi:hypothetical protein
MKSLYSFCPKLRFELSGFFLYAHVLWSALEAELFGDKRMRFSGIAKWSLCFKVFN